MGEMTFSSLSVSECLCFAQPCGSFSAGSSSSRDSTVLSTNVEWGGEILDRMR